MSKSELAEWLAMILVIVLWWPILFFNWGPAPYRIFLYAYSILALGIILVRRWRRVNEGFAVSESMMRAKLAAEEQARGGKPSLDEKRPPDVSDRLPFAPPASPPPEQPGPRK